MIPVSADGVEWTEVLTRAAVKGRSGGLCEYHRDHPADDMHHRRNASQGGRWHPANIIHLCRPLHEAVTTHPTWAASIGLSLTAGQEPEDVGVALPDGPALFLTDELIAKAGINA